MSALMWIRPRRSVWSVPQRLGTFITQRLWTFIMQAEAGWGGGHRRKTRRGGFFPALKLFAPTGSGESAPAAVSAQSAVGAPHRLFPLARSPSVLQADPHRWTPTAGPAPKARPPKSAGSISTLRAWLPRRGGLVDASPSLCLPLPPPHPHPSTPCASDSLSHFIPWWMRP